MDSQLNALVGEWTIGGNHPEFGDLELGRMSMEWMTGEQWVIQRWESAQPAFPSGVAVLGPAGGALRQNYFDSRGVQRVYEMALEGGVWTLERRDDDFWQRYRGEVGAEAITGAWEKAPAGGGEWELDFGIVYTRMG